MIVGTGNAFLRIAKRRIADNVDTQKPRMNPINVLMKKLPCDLPFMRTYPCVFQKHTWMPTYNPTSKWSDLILNHLLDLQNSVLSFCLS